MVIKNIEILGFIGPIIYHLIFRLGIINAKLVACREIYLKITME